MIFLTPKTSKLIIVIFLFLLLYGCATFPKDALKLNPQSLEKRQLQTRQYDTKNEEKIIAACAGVLQDLGFTIDESETKLGVIVASKDRDATNGGQVALATLAAIFGNSNAYSTIDAVQKIRVSVVSNPSLDGIKMLVRVTFQRVVWNQAGSVSRVETINDPKLYQGFFEKLSKAVFLEEQKI